MNNSTNFTPLLLIGIFFLTVGIVVFLFLTAEEPIPLDDTPVVTEFPDANQQDIVPIFGVRSRTGSTIETRNFLDDEGVELYSEEYGLYMIGSESGPGGNPLYEIQYVQGGGITVSLLSEDLPFARGRAEEKLQEVLGASLFEMCSMSIRVTTPVSYSEEYSGRDLGLSACPNSIQL